ncbi:MAG: AMP-binding protein [Bdellovibrionota bacterium]|nr:AMP-binding protein [Bdellovibrionota bacterium]
MNLSYEKTISSLFLKRIEKQKESKAIGWIKNDELQFYNFEKYYDIVECVYYGLNKYGLKIADKAAILSSTCKEWHIFDLANLCTGSIVIPLYPTYRAKDIAYILNHSESSFLFAESEDQIKKILPLKNEFKNLKTVVVLKKLNHSSEAALKKNFQFVYFQDLVAEGVHLRNDRPGLFREKLMTLDENSIATIVYTSKTTGKLKGSMISQKALFTMLSNISNTLAHHVTENDRTLTFLPLSHVFGRCDSLLPIALGIQGVYARSIKTIISDAIISKPTIIMAVPRVFEKICHKVSDEHMKEKSFLKQKVFNFLEEKTTQYFDKLDNDVSPSIKEIGLKNIGYQIFYSKIKSSLGGKIRFIVSGGAPLPDSITDLLKHSNMTVLEGYGLTETAAACFLNPISRPISGTVGIPLGDVQIKIANDGEILLKSECLFSGYFKEKAMTQTVMSNGWFKTGDIGKITPEGYLKITDRKKDIIVNSNGSSISPQKIEGLLKSENYISQAFVIANKQGSLTAIIGIEKASFIPILEDLNLPKNCSLENLANNGKVYEIIGESIESVNKRLSQSEKIKGHFISTEEFTHAGGHLTASQKLKRDWLEQKYAKEINDPRKN